MGRQLIKFTPSDENLLFRLPLNCCRVIPYDCKIQLMRIICSPLVLWVSGPAPGARLRGGKGELADPCRVEPG